MAVVCDAFFTLYKLGNILKANCSKKLTLNLHISIILSHSYSWEAVSLSLITVNK